MRKLHELLYNLPIAIKLFPLYGLFFYFLFSVFLPTNSTGMKIIIVVVAVISITIINWLFIKPKKIN